MTLTPVLRLPDGRWLDISGDVLDQKLGDGEDLIPERRAMWEAVARRGGHSLDELMGVTASGYTPDVGATPV